MTTLVSGAGSFIGGALVRRLRAAGVAVRTMVLETGLAQVVVPRGG